MDSPSGVRVHASPRAWCGSDGLAPVAWQSNRSCRHIGSANAADARGGAAESLAALGRVRPDDGAVRLFAVVGLVFDKPVAYSSLKLCRLVDQLELLAMDEN